VTFLKKNWKSCTRRVFFLPLGWWIWLESPARTWEFRVSWASGQHDDTFSRVAVGAFKLNNTPNHPHQEPTAGLQALITGLQRTFPHGREQSSALQILGRAARTEHESGDKRECVRSLSALLSHDWWSEVDVLLYFLHPASKHSWGLIGLYRNRKKRPCASKRKPR